MSLILGKTLNYTSIEQMGITTTTFTPATYIYSLGTTIYKCLTGITPPNAVLMASGEELAQLPAYVPECIQNAVYKAMQINKMKRPQNVEEFMKLLSQTADAVRNGNVADIEQTTVSDISNNAQNKGVIEIVNANDILFDIKGVKFKMIKVEGGNFMMKDKISEGFLGLSSKVITQKTVLSDYYIGETPVTQALWRIVMGNDPSFFLGDNLPVECINWDDCNMFISKLNLITGRYFRLPTEAEWEFAARGGNNSNHYQYSGSNKIGDVAWYEGNGGYRTHPVAGKQANELAIYDMSGNVFEWCSDWYGNYSNSPQVNPTGCSSGSLRVIRGGSYGYDASGCRWSFRDSSAPGYKNRALGFRLVLSPSNSENSK